MNLTHALVYVVSIGGACAVAACAEEESAERVSGASVVPVPSAGSTTNGDGGTAAGGHTPGGGGTSTQDGGALPDGAMPDGAGPSAPKAFAGGNPNGSCAAGLPPRATPVDVSKPTTVVGTGTAASCTGAALATAVAKGGVIVFDCGAAPTTIAITTTLVAPIDRDTVIDGGNRVTLDGQGKVRVLQFISPNFRAVDHGVTLQHLRIVGGKTTPTEAIPVAPAPCSQGFNDGEGGAVYMRDGFLTVIDCVFENNQAALLGPDTGGGAIYVLGSKGGVTIAKSTFSNNKASNGGAIGTLFAQLDVYDSLFTGNVATGNGANSDDATKCDAINNGQHEVGSGGNGGALYNDGASVNVSLCGDAILANNAGSGAFGGGLFFTSNDFGGTLTIRDTTMTGNTGGHWTVVSTGAVTNAGTAVGTNAKSITIVSSTLQGVP